MVTYDELTDEQQAAVDALERNVTLTAGAGTGKTTTLTARYLQMVERSVTATTDAAAEDKLLLPEAILTTTFTERAATELEESVRNEITSRLSSLDPDAFAAWRTVADELEHGYIHTLHGFCARLLREHALHVDGLHPGFETLDETAATALIDTAVDTVLEANDDSDAVRTLARRFSREQLHEIVTDLVAERPDSVTWAQNWHDASVEEYLSFVEQTLHPVDPDDAADRLAHPAVSDSLQTLQELVENPPDISTGGRAWKRVVDLVAMLDDGFDDGVASRRKQTTLAALSSHLTTTDGERYASYTGAKTRWQETPAKAVFDEAITQLVETLQPEDHAVRVDFEHEAASFQFVQALAEVTLLAVTEYDRRKQQQNAVDFSDLITHTVGLLADESNQDIRAALQDQFEYVMLDEFQDTDPRQWELIRLLTDDDGTGVDAENVFVVGDVKQSIYRFRNADVTQFTEITKTLQQDSPEGPHAPTQPDDQLSTNFRTLPAVLETINELFDAIFEPEGAAYEAAPQRLTPARTDPAALASTEYLFVPTNPGLREARCDHYPAFAEATPEHDAELEAMALAARLSQVLAEPYQVYPDDTTADTPPDPRAIEPSDIAVLLRSRTHLKAYERALDDAGVPYTVASGIGFYDTPEVTALVNCFQALADPADERALYAVLRSPLFGFTDDTLARLTVTADTLWDALGATDNTALADAYDRLTDWRARAGCGDGDAGIDGSWAEFLSEIIEETGYLVSVSAGDRPAQAVANVDKFREQLREWSDGGGHSVTTLVTQIERRVDASSRESEAETTDDGVQILTIHDAKGMEFPFVAVPEVGRQFNNEAALGNGAVEFERVGDEHAVGMKTPHPAAPFTMEDTIARDALRDQRQAEERAEEKRVLYVACTRARDHLLLSGRHAQADDADQSLTGIEAPDPETATQWRDWIQPELLSPELLATLDTRTQVERSYGEGSYRVTLPTPAVAVDAGQPPTDPTVTLSPSPAQPAWQFQLSATDFAALRGGHGEIRRNHDARTLYVEDVYETPDDRHGVDDGTAAAADTAQAAGQPEHATDVEPRIFGELVHRLCELRPPRSQWPDLMQQTLVAEDATGDLTEDLQQRVATHASRGIAYVDEQIEDASVDQQYDELYVTAAFDNGEITGFIDHLIVTPARYHIIDYKTGTVDESGIEEDATYYQNQLKAYAVALHQHDPHRQVRASLVFTDPDQAWHTEWHRDELDEIESAIQQTIESHLPDR
mgnify:FL=1